jgi:hypothetical protein
MNENSSEKVLSSFEKSVAATISVIRKGDQLHIPEIGEPTIVLNEFK